MKQLNAAEVKQVAKELKIKDWWNKKRDVLVAEIAEVKGWSSEKTEIIEFLLAGGEITKCPAPEFPAPRPNREDQAMLTPEKRKPRKRPTKKSETLEKKSKKTESTEGRVTLSQICEELGVEGRIARRKLRGSKIEKPGSTWAWPEGDESIEEVKDLLK